MTPDRSLELELLAGLPDGAVLAGVDEVGRGSLAGPVCVGIALVDANVGDFPEGLRDSKQMSASARDRLDPLAREWALEIAVGYAGSDVVDERGIIAALRVAAADALSKLSRVPDAVLLDGSHNWWDAESLFDESGLLPAVPVTMKVKGDASCAVVAAASVAAKVERDRFMVERDAEYPGYDWAKNKGYSSPAHSEGLRMLGASKLHRVSWNLPGLGGNDERD